MGLPFANVPILPGVPILPRPNPLPLAISVALLTADAIVSFFLGGGPQWGIFLNGFPVVEADSVVAFEFRKDWVISDYPQEDGAFQSYDKVETPFIARVRFTAGGDEANRAALLQSIQAIAGDTNLYDVVTPEAVYTSCSIGHYDYSRRATQGVGIISVDVWLVEVRVTALESFSNTASPSGASPQDGGTVNSLPAPTSAQTQVFNNTGAV